MKLMMRFMQLFIFLALLSLALMNCSTPEPKACEKNGDCASGRCVKKKCVPAKGEGSNVDGGGSADKGPPPKACKKDKDCEAGQFCKANFCSKLPDVCKSSAECGTTLYCNPKTKKCEEKTCKTDAECSKGEFCNPKSKKCEIAKACDKNKPCADGLICDTCRKVCTGTTKGTRCNYDYNCPGGIENSWCDTCINQCRPKRKVCEPCTKNKECGEPDDFCIPDQLNPESGKKFCARKCVQDSLCPPGYKCKKFASAEYTSSPFQCIPASADCSRPGECESNSDCPGSGKICDPRTKRCVPGCASDTNCRVKDVGACNAGKCSQTGAKCIGTRCMQQLKCCRGRCGSPCSGDSECERAEKCKKGCCQLEGECKESKDCPVKNYCDKKTGLCTPGCTLASDCGLPDPKRSRCRFKCRNNKCEEDCRCRNQHIDCTPVRFCPTAAAVDKDKLAPCRKPKGPVCKTCANDTQCGCKPGDDCKFICTKKECAKDDDCKGTPGGATVCYNKRCSTKKACVIDKDCPASEKCENNFCAANCNNRCLKFQSGAICMPACDPLGNGSECPSRFSCSELLPQSGSGPKCLGGGDICRKNSDCKGKYKTCGPDGYCTVCPKGQVCRGLDAKDPLKIICIPMPPTVCLGNPTLCKDGGF